jgi:hypothetical protein
MENLKNKVEKILQVNIIEFELIYHHKGHFIDITGADEIKDDLETWIGYEVLIEYLVGKDILYNFSGSFVLKEDKILIYVSFTGPYEGEFESVELPIDNIFSNENIKKDIEKVISTEIDLSELSVQFCFDESDDFKYFDISYWSETRNWIELTENLSLESISYVKTFLTDYIKSNVPRLNLPSEIEQEYYAECEENTIRYYINSSDMVIEWDAVEN